MSDREISAEQAAAITAFVDIQAPPPDDLPTAHFIFGTNQLMPVTVLVTERHKRGLAPLIIVTGGVNRHTGIIEGREFHRVLTENGVPDEDIRVEDASANTWQNVENAAPFIHEALAAGLKITAVSKWFHRRTVHALKIQTPGLGGFYALGWEPEYHGQPVTRTNWLTIPDGKRRVIREWEEINRRLAAHDIVPSDLVDGTWQ
ncbi:YdcF family protein [Actinocorallia populi]|uniref:YdcF family protein n=1 Tax=Actinocorallia populi TaxID=2079200 RepID=UPI000D090F46|nr:YdcF family protein [Actinocorallia populi]